MDRGLEVLVDPAYTEKLAPITAEIAEAIYEKAYVNHSLMNECGKRRGRYHPGLVDSGGDGGGLYQRLAEKARGEKVPSGC